VASPSARSPRPLAALVAVVVLLLGAGWLVSHTGSSGAGNAAKAIPTVRTAELPAEAQQTLVLIKSGGPFPYPEDGIVFTNLEGLLPGRPSGYYREYTVVTPGSGDRGARRIVAGQQGEEYYTDDHYASFREVLP
jgi:ribonuclease T1